MATISLLVKDLREHRLAAIVLSAACLVVVVLLLAQNKAAAYSMSPFEVVRFSLISFLPLLALIVGNRLIVREYLSGTRLFVEALPVGNFLPLILKYLLGLAFILFIALGMVFLASQQSSIADDITLQYVQLIVIKTLVVASLYWSIVFCFSLCGYLRIALYLLLVGIVFLIAFIPSLDGAKLPPFALMDEQLFVYERDSVPWKDIQGTLLISLLFTVAGFALTRIGEGSVVERLAKPMARRDYVALGMLAATGLIIVATLAERNQRQPIEFTSEAVFRVTDPNVSVLYLDPQYEDSAKEIALRTSESLRQLQATLGLISVPTVRLSLSPSREKHEFDYATHDGVFVTANWLEHDSYDTAILDSVVMHGVLSNQTQSRAMFEPYHWVLDGFTRWWVEQGVRDSLPSHRAQLIARALLVLQRDSNANQLVDRWQLLADKHSYPSAEALAWASLTYLEETSGRDAVFRLAREFLIEPMGSTILDVANDRRESSALRFERVMSMPLEQFQEGWKQWLLAQRNNAAVQSIINAIPAWSGQIATRQDTSGSLWLDGAYVRLNTVQPDAEIGEEFEGTCIMKHDYIGPFDNEFDVSDDYEHVADCQLSIVAHSIGSTYASGDRVFVALDYEDGPFNQPIRLHAERVYIP